MNALENCKVVVMNVNAISSTAAEAGDLYVDTAGYHYATFIVSTPQPTSGGTATFTSLVLNHGDTTSTISTALLTGGTDFTLPTSSDTAQAASGILNVDLRGKKRYMNFTSAATAASYVNQTFICILSKADESPNSAAEAGVTSRYSG